MSKIIFEFDTSGEDAISEKENAFRCMKSLDLALALSDIREISLKNDDEEFKNAYFDILERYDINLDEMIS